MFVHNRQSHEAKVMFFFKGDGIVKGNLDGTISQIDIQSFHGCIKIDDILISGVALRILADFYSSYENSVSCTIHQSKNDSGVESC